MKKVVNCLISFVFAVSSVLFSQSLRLVPSGALTLQNPLDEKRLPHWGGGALVVAEGTAAESNAFLSYDKAGKILSNVGFEIEGAAHTYVFDFARAADGTLALCGTSYDRDGRDAPFFAWISANGSTERIVRTEPYRPRLITIASDGTFWTVGREADSHGSDKHGGVDLNAGVLRHFDREGKQLGALIPRSGIADIAQLDASHGYLAASEGIIGWLRHGGAEFEGQGAYVEVSPSGDLTTYALPKLPRAGMYWLFHGMAMTQSGQVFVSMTFVEVSGTTQVQQSSVFMLDRKLRDWVAVPIAAPNAAAFKWVGLYGANGSDLVARLPGDSPSQIHFLAPMGG